VKYILNPLEHHKQQEVCAVL